MIPNSIDLTSLGNLYLIANTPLFLIRRLEESQEVRMLAETHSSAKLFGAIEESLHRDPESPAEAALPFACLLALRAQGATEEFLRAADLSSPRLPWYPVVAQMLKSLFIPTKTQSLKIPGNANVTVQFDVIPAVHGTRGNEILSCSQ